MNMGICGGRIDQYYPDKSDLTKWLYDLWEYVKQLGEIDEKVIEEAVNKYLEEHPIEGDFAKAQQVGDNLVISFGDSQALFNATGVTYLYQNSPVWTAYSDRNPPPYPVTSVNGQTGAVEIQTGDPTAYTPTNPPPYPVTSVNGQTGAVNVTPGPDSYVIMNDSVDYTTYVNNTGESSTTKHIGLTSTYPYGADKDGFLWLGYTNKNEPNYPVRTVNGLVGDPLVPYVYVVYPGQVITLLVNVLYFIRGTFTITSLPPGNSTYVQLYTTDTDNSIFPFSISCSPFLLQSSYASTSNTTGGVVITNPVIEGTEVSGTIYYNALIRASSTCNVTIGGSI